MRFSVVLAGLVLASSTAAAPATASVSESTNSTDSTVRYLHRRDHCHGKECRVCGIVKAFEGGDRNKVIHSEPLVLRPEEADKVLTCEKFADTKFDLLEVYRNDEKGGDHCHCSFWMYVYLIGSIVLLPSYAPPFFRELIYAPANDNLEEICAWVNTRATRRSE